MLWLFARGFHGWYLNCESWGRGDFPLLFSLNL